jgi:outer membrane protein OmpA-like peptidoglycan-associated protein
METMRWRRYVDGLRTHPGIVVTSAEAGLRTYSISGLRDPLAADPARALGESRIDPARIKAIWNPYVSAAPELVLLRARTRLEPPPTVVLTVSGETLRASGVAPTAWRSKAAAMATSVPGVEQFDVRALEVLELQDLRRQAGELQSTQVLFGVGSSWIRPDQNRAISEIAAHIRRIVQLADAAPNSVVIRITGHTDETGGAMENYALSRERARSVLALLKRQGFNPRSFVTEGVGTSQPVRTGANNEGRAFNRSVRFRVSWGGAPAKTEQPQ